MNASTATALLDTASARYRRAGRFAWYFARGKLGGDPAFRALLQLGLLAGRTRILDLGCGQGLLATWLQAAHDCYAGKGPGAWPPEWPAPPQLRAYTGIELNPREVERARIGLAHCDAEVTLLEGNICDVAYPAVDAVVIMDVLHYLDYPAQEEVLRRVHAALPPNGLLLTRIGDAAGGRGFLLSKWVDHIVMLLRGRHWQPLSCRTLSQWCTLLERLGFKVTSMPMSEGTPFTNVLLMAEVR
ncbi:MAG: class I SAM-dependent methyltransferase [Proteobacteria bacterium]|nr:class I SAM-dependent methyltransferase [Pseudomonadota bacterium]